MQEELEGVGQLEKWEQSDKKHEVGYQFTISTEIVARPGEGVRRSVGGWRRWDAFYATCSIELP